MSNTYRTFEKEINNPLSWNIQNSIIWGNFPGEILLTINQISDFTITASHNVLKTQLNDIFQGNNNQLNVKPTPLFVDPQILDFRPDALSPLINTGANINVIDDITGKKRDLLPDIGAYEL
jgi:hypothetical protein